MKKNLLMTLLAVTALLQQPKSAQMLAAAADSNAITREVRHELAMLPYYSIFDNLEYQVTAGVVTLEGQIIRPSLKPDAEYSVKKIEGVKKVINNIEVLPPSPADDRIRLAVYYAMFGQNSPLMRYALGTLPSIHIVVKNGAVTLVGTVDNEADKTIATAFANKVSGIFSVTNNLRVKQPG